MRKSQITPERKQRKKRFFNSICTPPEHPDSPQNLYLWDFSQFSPLLKLGKSKYILKYIYLSQTVDKVGAGSYPQHHFSVNSLCFNKNLKKLQDSFILDSLISKIFASFFKFIHANVSPAFISIRAFPMY